MTQYEVPEPIINTPFEEPAQHWYIREGEEPELRPGRRPAIVYPPRDETGDWDLGGGILRLSAEYRPGYEMAMVNLVRERLKAWRQAGWPGVTRTTLELLRYWRREGRDMKKRLFFAQLEAAETVIFLTEARADFRQGINVPVDEPSEQQRAEGARAFGRYACKMATGGGKTTVMGMLAAWSILNKVNDRSDGRFSDVVLVVCPNITIKNRLAELDPNGGDASLYRTRDLVPQHMMSLLTQGRVLVTNWHILGLQEAQTVGGVNAKVAKTGRPLRTTETITIGSKTTTARRTRYLTQEELDRQVAAGMVTVIPGSEVREKDGSLKKVRVESVRYVESDTHWIGRVIGREVGGKQNILVFNDEAHHAYRIRREAEEEERAYPDEPDEEDVDDFFQEATVWVDGLDRIHKMRGINFCVDLSATPYFLGRVGQDTNKPFPWVVSDFGLIDAIESGLVKIPQLAVRDSTGAAIEDTCYFDLWDWMLRKMTEKEKGGRKGTPNPAAILKYANHPIAIMGGLWEEEYDRWERENIQDPRRPVFILVCKNTQIAKVVYEWLAEGNPPPGIPPANIEKARNRDGQINTIRVDTKVVHETDTDGGKSDETRWMRLTLDTVGKHAWPADSQGQPIYPEDFEELAKKLGRPLHPPGRDIRCIVSVGMLTEGWDCCTVTHIIGLRPFMSQLLCEQVVGRGLRRRSYDVEDGDRFKEEVAKVFGVPFEVIPFKANPQGPAKEPPKRWHVHALPNKEEFRIEFPRVDGYTQAIRDRIMVDWASVPPLFINPGEIPPEVDVKAFSLTTDGKMSLNGPGNIEDVNLDQFRAKRRLQELVFDLAGSLTRFYMAQNQCEVPVHRLFPQVVTIVQKYVADKVHVQVPASVKDLFLAPYYGWLVERLGMAIQPDTSRGETPEVPVYESHRGPGSTEDVDYWTKREPREAIRCHLNYVVPDTAKWEQCAAFHIDRHPATAAFVKNAGLGFAIPYFHNGQSHDYIPDFIIRLKGEGEQGRFLILETKGFDPLADVKKAAGDRWVAAVNADGRCGHWLYDMIHKPEEASQKLDAAI
jgi:type III restriction enzyme